MDKQGSHVIKSQKKIQLEQKAGKQKKNKTLVN